MNLATVIPLIIQVVLTVTQSNKSQKYKYLSSNLCAYYFIYSMSQEEIDELILSGMIEQHSDTISAGIITLNSNVHQQIAVETTVHEQTWTSIPSVSSDHTFKYSNPTRLHAEINPLMASSLDYFYASFPMRYLHNTIIPESETEFRRQNIRPMDAGEFLQFLGITLAMAHTPLRGGINTYWEESNGDDRNSLHIGGNYRKRFGMARDTDSKTLEVISS